MFIMIQYKCMCICIGYKICFPLSVRLRMGFSSVEVQEKMSENIRIQLGQHTSKGLLHVGYVL